MPMKGEYVKFKNYERKIWKENLCRFWKNSSAEDNEIKIQTILIQTNIKNLFYTVTAINECWWYT